MEFSENPFHVAPPGDKDSYIDVHYFVLVFIQNKGVNVTVNMPAEAALFHFIFGISSIIIVHHFPSQTKAIQNL